MTLHKFYFFAFTLANQKGWRYGQALFNHLDSVRPDLADKVRGAIFRSAIKP